MMAVMGAFSMRCHMMMAVMGANGGGYCLFLTHCYLFLMHMLCFPHRIGV